MYMCFPEDALEERKEKKIKERQSCGVFGSFLLFGQVFFIFFPSNVVATPFYGLSLLRIRVSSDEFFSSKMKSLLVFVS